MKKFIARILLFIPFLFISYYFLLLAWHRLAPSYIETNLNYKVAAYSYMYSRMSEIKRTKDVDILFLGSSHAYRGFDPRIFKEYGYKSFNLGSTIQTPIQTKFLLDRYLNTLNPKLIIYEVTPRTFEDDGVESSLDVLANDKIDVGSLKMALSLNNIKTYNTLLYGYYLQLFSKNEIFEEEVVREAGLYVSGGYVENKLPHSQKGFDKYEMKEWDPLSFQLNCFVSILKMCKRKKIKLVLVQAPIPRHEYDHYYENNSSIDSYFLSKTPYYYNFNNLLKMNDYLDYFDNHHLNQPAVRIFNEELIKKVIMNILPAMTSRRLK